MRRVKDGDLQRSSRCTPAADENKECVQMRETEAFATSFAVLSLLLKAVPRSWCLASAALGPCNPEAINQDVVQNGKN